MANQWIKTIKTSLVISYIGGWYESRTITTLTEAKLFCPVKNFKYRPNVRFLNDK
jgi:GTPase SAR1 family protein